MMFLRRRRPTPVRKAPRCPCCGLPVGDHRPPDLPPKDYRWVSVYVERQRAREREL